MGLVLFDCKFFNSMENCLISLFSMVYLFDGYLTELTSYQQLTKLFYLTEKGPNQLKRSLKRLYSKVYLFDGYLTEH